MYKERRVSAIIPARNEGLNIESVVYGLRKLRSESGQSLVDSIVVCDNGSSDKTAAIARQAGAVVVQEPKPGYGAACLRAVQASPASDVLLFVDGDDSINYEESFELLAAIDRGADLVIGARRAERMESGAMTLPQRFGNWLAVRCIGQLWQEEISDLGPFRAIRTVAYQSLSMQDQAFGWTVEMQVKAIQKGLVTAEVSVSCRRRRGVSKISGSVSGIVKAAHGILGTIAVLWVREKALALNSKAPKAKRIG